MKILITGGTGFIGQSLCPALHSAGHSITILSRYPNKVSSIFGDQIQQLNSVKYLADDAHFDAIINFAGAPIFASRWTDKRKQILLESRVDITCQLIEFIERTATKPAVFLSGSAIGFYGDQGDTLLDESASVLEQDNFGHQLCAAWEQTANKAKEQGVRVCILRTGLVIGKHGGFLQPMILPFKLGLGAKLGSGTQWMPWIHMDDYVAICQTLLNKDELEGVFNLTAPNPTTNNDFTRVLAKQLKRPAFLTTPAWALNLLLGEMSQLLLGSQRVIPKHLLDTGYQFKYTELEAALENVLQK